MKIYTLTISIFIVMVLAGCTTPAAIPPTPTESVVQATIDPNPELGDEMPLPTFTLTPDLPTLPPMAALNAQQFLAGQLAVDVSQVIIISSEQVEWPDSCLGLGGAAETCAAAITPGWRVLLEVDSQEYEVRTDDAGVTMRVAP